MLEHAQGAGPRGFRPASSRSGRPRSRSAAKQAGRARPAKAAPPPSALEQALAAALAAPPPAATTFAELGLPQQLVAALAEQGISTPFAIQARALPDALAGLDILGRAQTGSGKTLAFGLPMLARLAGQPGARRAHAPRGLVLVPTRELAKQVSEVLAPLGRPVGLTVTTIYGGASMLRQIEMLRSGVDIAVATPGRLIDLMDRGSCRLDQVDVAVLDEADHMSDLGFYPAVRQILQQVPAGGQRLLFSATLDRDVERLVAEFLPEPAVHAVESVDAATAADHQVFVLPAADKLSVAAEIAARPARTLIFVRTKHGAARLASQLTKAGAPAAAIHGNLNQGQRQRALEAFTAGHPRVLVATDVAARGLHIDDVDLVVHYDPPADHKDYLHRSGRTARAGATGTVLAFVDPAQVKDVAKLHDAAGVTPTRHDVEPGHVAVREIATSGEPVPPPPPPRPQRAAAGGRPARPARRRAAAAADRRDAPEGPERAAGSSADRSTRPSRQGKAPHAPARGRGWAPAQPASDRPSPGEERAGRPDARGHAAGERPARPSRDERGAGGARWSGADGVRGAGPARRPAADNARGAREPRWSGVERSAGGARWSGADGGRGARWSGADGGRGPRAAGRSGMDDAPGAGPARRPGVDGNRGAGAARRSGATGAGGAASARRSFDDARGAGPARRRGPGGQGSVRFAPGASGSGSRGPAGRPR